MVGGFLVDHDGGDRIADGEPLPAGGARSCVAGWDRRLFTDASEVIVSSAPFIPVHLGHFLSLASLETDVEHSH